MPTRAQVCTWIAAVSLLAPSVAAGQDRTERDVVELIVRDGPQARAIRAGAEVTRREQLARLAYPNPSVTYSREGAGFTEFFQAEQSLPMFGVRAALSRVGVAATAAAEAERDVRLWLLRSDAAAAVARVVAEQARLESARAQVREVARLIEILRTREREGEGSRFDRLRAEQELRDTHQLVTSTVVALTEARATLSGMLPRDVSLSTIATGTIPQQPPVTTEALLTRATSTRAELRALQRLGERATLEAEAARRARLPSPSVFGGVKRADDASGRATGGVFGVSVGLPLFDAGGREAARWEAERARIEAERAAIEYQVRSEITGASEVFAVRQTALSEERQGAAEELVEIVEVAYREGEVGILELLDAVRTASRARFRAIDLRLGARLAQIALERAVGETLWP
ncbi:MAG: TolC family protein [Acidobacteria bacterium]|nr:TolC family protein [Acidobacteriota bacterium]MCA1652444.1 TolC family protein [Acidobacteriota bacterium]